MTHRILFVCLGNICRSPTAEAVTQKLAQEASIPAEFDSAGTSSWHIGDPPYEPMQEAAKAQGYDLSPLRARQVNAQDFTAFDLIIAMDEDNLNKLQKMRPEHARATLSLFTEYQPDPKVTFVPDPYYTRDFDGALQLIENCAKGLLDRL